MRSSSLPPDLKETPVRRSPMQTAGSLSTPPKVNRVIPLVQCPPTVERVRRNQADWWKKSEPSIGYFEGDNKSELTEVMTLKGYRVHQQTNLVDQYRIAVNEYREASDSLADDSDDDLEDSDGWVEDYRPRRSHHHWQGRYDFIFSVLTYNCNWATLWRLPYMILTLGGGTFLLLVFIQSLLFGLPILLLECSIGQLTRSGPVRAMERMCTLSQGVGMAMSLLSLLTSIYHTVILAWDLKLLVSSANVPLLWTNCHQIWNDNTTCVGHQVPVNERQRLHWRLQTHQLKGIVPALNLQNYYEDSPAEQFFYKRLLDSDYSQTSSFLNIRGEIAACLFVIWLWTYFCIWKRRKTSQISRQLSMALLYLFMLFPLVKFCLEDGDFQLSRQYIVPRFSHLGNVGLWCCSLGFVCNLYGLGFGVPMELAASNSFSNRHLILDVFIIVLVSLVLVTFVGLTFILGASAIASSKNIEISDLGYNVETVFIVILHTFSDLPFAQLHLLLFFSIFLIVGLSTVFFQLDLVISALQDNFWKCLNKYFKSREVLSGSNYCHSFRELNIFLFSAIICFVCFCVGLLFCTRAGHFNIFLADLHLAIFCPPILVALETFFVFRCYGWSDLKRNIVEMTGFDIYNSTFYVFLVIVLVSLVGGVACQVSSYPTVLGRMFPVTASLAGACLTSLPVFVFLWVCLVKINNTEGKTIRTKLRIVTQTNIEECKCHR